jgi:type I restriction enzyme S subunit
LNTSDSKKRTPYIFRKEDTEVPNSWDIRKYGDVVNLEYGNNLPKKDRIEGEFPVYGSNGITGWHNDYHIEPPGIVVGRKGTLETKWSNKRFNVIDTAYYVNEECITSESLDIKYLLYNLKTFDFQVLESGSAVPSLSRDDFYNETVAIPPIPEQKKIASILSKIDEKIEANNRIVETLEKMSQSIFKSWFLDFEPYDEFEQSELGKIPVDFEVVELGEILSLEYGDGLSKDDRDGGEFPVYGSNGINGSHSEFLIEGPGVIVGRKGTIGTVNYESGNFWCIDTTFYLDRKEDYDLLFYYNLLKYGVRLKHLGSDSAVPGLNRNTVHDQKVAIPNETQVSEFVELIKPMYRIKDDIRNENENLVDIRDTLVPKLMSGEIRVNDIELDELEVDSEV